MSVELQDQRIVYLGNGTATTFAFPFTVDDGSQVKVVVADETGTETTLAYGDDYTVTLNEQPDGIRLSDGSVVLTEALPMGKKIALVSNIPQVQQRTFPDNTPYYQEQIEGAIDKNTRLIQQLSEQVDRSVKVSETSDLSAEEIMESVERNAILVEQTKEECLAALEEIHEANYAPQTQVDALTETVAGVSNVADAASSAAGTNTAAIGELTDDLAEVSAVAQNAAEVASQALALASSAIAFKGAVATTGALPADAAAGDIYVVEADDKTYISDGEGNWTEFNAINVDLSLIASSTNPVAGGVVKTALDAKADDSTVVKLAGEQNLTASKTWTNANQGPTVTNTGGTLTISLRVSDTPWGGLYDITNSDWLIGRNGEGKFSISAKKDGVYKYLQGYPNGTLTWGGADITGDAKTATLSPTPKMFGAAGNGSTNDTTAFSSLENARTGQVVDLLGCTYVLDHNFSKNTYVNGKFKIGGVTIEMPEHICAADEIPQDTGSVVMELPYMNSGNGKWIWGAQGFARSGGNLYVFQPYMSNDAGTVVQQTMIHRYTFNASGNPVYANSSGNSPQLGHQGVYVDGSGKLIVSLQDKDKMGRLTYSSGTVYSAANKNIETITLFPQSYQPNSNYSPTPTLSKDKRWLIARSLDADGNHLIRIWDYGAIKDVVTTTGGVTTGDWTQLYTREIKIPGVPKQDPLVQAMLMDKDHIYILSGNNSVSKNKQFFVYDLTGRLVYKTTTFHVGYETASTYTGANHVFEPEGLNFIEDGGTSRIGVMFVCGNSSQNRHMYISRLAV